MRGILDSISYTSFAIQILCITADLAINENCRTLGINCSSTSSLVFQYYFWLFFFQCSYSQCYQNVYYYANTVDKFEILNNHSCLLNGNDSDDFAIFLGGVIKNSITIMVC